MRPAPRTFYGFVHEGKLVLSAKVSFAEHVRKHFKEGDDIEITVAPKRSRRTKAQNAAFYAALLAPWAEQEGHDVDDLKRDLLGTIFGWSDKKSPLTGQPVPLKAHTSDLTVEEGSIFIDRSIQIAAECGVFLLAPDEYREKKGRRR